MTDLSLPPSGRTTRIPRAALRHYGAGANPRPAILLTPHYRSAVGARGEGGKRRVIYKGIKEGLESLPHISKAKGRVLLVRCPPCPCYGWHHPSHDPTGGGGATVRALHVLPQPYPLELSSRWKGGWTAQGGAARAPTCQKDSSCGCRERCGGDDGVRNMAHTELTWTAAGTVQPLSDVHVVYTPTRCLAALREASAGTRR